MRERDWANVITAHEGDTAAYTWRLQHFTLGEHVLTPAAKKRKLNPEPAPLSSVTSVAISCCGNFGFVGSASGHVDRYNMQSGLHRGAYARYVATFSLQNGAFYAFMKAKVLMLTVRSTLVFDELHNIEKILCQRDSPELWCTAKEDIESE